MEKITLIEDPVSIVNSIITEAAEKYDEFVFRTIQPYCEKTMEMKISKEQLIDAIRLQKQLVR